MKENVSPGLTLKSTDCATNLLFDDYTINLPKSENLFDFTLDNKNCLLFLSHLDSIKIG